MDTVLFEYQKTLESIVIVYFRVYIDAQGRRGVFMASKSDLDNKEASGMGGTYTT